MLMLIQQETAATPSLPWWVMYVVLLGLTYGTWRLTKLAWWGGCMTALMSWVILLAIAVLTFPDHVLLVLWLPIVPAIAWVVALRRHHRGVSPRAEIAARFPRRTGQLPPQVMHGQPSARAVTRAKVMLDRFAAGMPRNAAFVARVRYVSGLGEMSARPVDLFMGGGSLWVAPLTADPPPVPIPARDVLRVDVWPEPEGPPTLRVNWSPPGAEGTRDLVLAAMGSVPQNLVTPQLEAIAGVLGGLIRAETEAAELAAQAPTSFIPPPDRACPRCGETVPPGATACPRCALPLKED
ncbi:MAG TPA: zinc ribbon domain-containing protein [Longimicrobium sp.]